MVLIPFVFSLFAVKTEDWLILGGAGLVLLWLFGQKNNGSEEGASYAQQFGESAGSGVGTAIGGGIAGAALGLVSGTIGGAYSAGASVGEALAEQFNATVQPIAAGAFDWWDDFSSNPLARFQLPALGWAGLGWF